MRFIFAEESIIKCICHATAPVTYSYLMSQTNMDFLTVDKNLKQMISDGRVEISIENGFAITRQTKKNPFVRLMLQEVYEEKLADEKNQYSRQHKLVQKFFNLLSGRFMDGQKK